MRYFLLGDAYHADELVDEALPDGAIALPRLPLVGEHWNSDAAAFVTDNSVVADMRVPEGHIDAAHALKGAEAAVIASGTTLTQGLLAEEAAALGIDLATLAAEVLAKMADFRTIEVNRRKLKTRV